MTAALPLPLHSPDCPAGIGCPTCGAAMIYYDGWNCPNGCDIQHNEKNPDVGEKGKTNE